MEGTQEFVSLKKIPILTLTVMEFVYCYFVCICDSLMIEGEL